MELHLGQTFDSEFILTEENLATHVLISGGSGGGKSKLTRLMIEQMAEQDQGCALVDTDSLTAQEAYAAIHASTKVSAERKKKTILLQPGPEKTFKFDPFDTDLTGKEYRYWLFRQVKQTGRILGRKQGQADYKEQPTRERWMGNVLWLVGTKVNGKHLGLHRALDVLRLGTPAWDRMFSKVEPYLPDQVVFDWKELRTMSFRDRRLETHSTANWFIQFFSDLVIETLSGPGEPINFRKIVSEGWTLLCDFGETSFFSKEQGEAFAAMVISSLLDAAYFVE